MYLYTITRKKTPPLDEFSICTRVLYLSDIILKEHKIWGRLRSIFIQEEININFRSGELSKTRALLKLQASQIL